MKRHALAWLAFALCVSAGLYLYWSNARPAPLTPARRPDSPGERAPRIASLSPAVTDTIVALGAQSSLVVVSDYCRLDGVARAGSIISPRFEQLAAAKPDLIVATKVSGSLDRELSQIAPLEALPWLTLQEVVVSVRRLGDAVHRRSEADALAHRLDQELAERAAADAPRVLALLGPLGEERIGYYFVRNDSLHGRLITSNGYRNAMAHHPPGGQPHLSVEQLLAVNPDVILVLQERPPSGPDPLAAFSPLDAVRSGRTRVLHRPGILSMGPDILDTNDLVRQGLRQLLAERPL